MGTVYTIYFHVDPYLFQLVQVSHMIPDITMSWYHTSECLFIASSLLLAHSVGLRLDCISVTMGIVNPYFQVV